MDKYFNKRALLYFSYSTRYLGLHSDLQSYSQSDYDVCSGTKPIIKAPNTKQSGNIYYHLLSLCSKWKWDLRWWFQNIWRRSFLLLYRSGRSCLCGSNWHVGRQNSELGHSQLNTAVQKRVSSIPYVISFSLWTESRSKNCYYGFQADMMAIL